MQCGFFFSARNGPLHRQGIDPFFPDFFSGQLIQRPFVIIQLAFVMVQENLAAPGPVCLIVYQNQFAVFLKIRVNDTLDPEYGYLGYLTGLFL